MGDEGDRPLAAAAAVRDLLVALQPDALADGRRIEGTLGRGPRDGEAGRGRLEHRGEERHVVHAPPAEDAAAPGASRGN